MDDRAPQTIERMCHILEAINSVEYPWMRLPKYSDYRSYFYFIFSERWKNRNGFFSNDSIFFISFHSFLWIFKNEIFTHVVFCSMIYVSSLLVFLCNNRNVLIIDMENFIRKIESMKIEEEGKYDAGNSYFLWGVYWTL